MTRRRYKILHLITRLDLGGAQQNTLYCCAHHDRSRFAVRLIAGAGGVLDDEARRLDDVDVRIVPWLKYAVSPASDALALLRLRAQMIRERIDLVHTHSSKAGLLGRVAAHLAGVPVVVHTAHGWSFNDTQPVLVRAAYVALERFAARLTDRLITVSSRHRRVGLEQGIGTPDGTIVIRSGIDVAAWATPRVERESVRRQLGIEPHHRLVGCVACLKPQKAPLDFVRAAAAAHAKDTDLRFVIAGDGELRPAVAAEIGRHGLDGVVRLLGWRRDVADLLHAMDLFLLTSRFEGLPRAVLQAAASGVPIVASDVDGTPEVIEHRTSGMLFPPGRPELAAQSVLELLRDAELRARCVREARARLTGEFDIAEMVRRLDRLYLDRLERPVQPAFEGNAIHPV
ncbi:MAG TPA: glycosyltransferase family 4 protein [Candidatus Polarisedimenticolaceae bacterium]|nr:glycosyltransferase family 4 protein [Candidatus Polarisedimenticolaceae bacterium]